MSEVWDEVNDAYTLGKGDYHALVFVGIVTFQQQPPHVMSEMAMPAEKLYKPLWLLWPTTFGLHRDLHVFEQTGLRRFAKFLARQRKLTYI